MTGSKPNMQKAERNWAILEKWRAGRKMKDLAAEYGICYGRVRDIIIQQQRLERIYRERKRALGIPEE